MRRRQIVSIAVAAVLAASVLEGEAGERYRDVVFANVTKTADIVYGNAVDDTGVSEDLTLDLYEPAGDHESFRPVYIWAHGGFHKFGDKTDGGPYLDYAMRGWVTLSIDYRLSTLAPTGAGGIVTEGDPLNDSERWLRAVRDDQHDMQAAVRWVRANAARLRLDASRIAVAGYSAGAETALTAAFNADDPGDSGNPAYPSDVAAAVAHAGVYGPGLPSDCPGTRLCRLYGTISLGEPPVAMIHGTNDTTIPMVAIFPACIETIALLNICEVTPVLGAEHVIAAPDVALDFLHRRVIEAPRAPTTLVLAPAGGSAAVGDVVSVAAKLTSGDTPLAGKRVTFLLGESRSDATTDADGVATAELTAAAPAGQSTLSATFSGEQTMPMGAITSGAGFAGARDAVSFAVTN